jgi:tetratricopeptide (TPR) repeat protein
MEAEPAPYTDLGLALAYDALGRRTAADAALAHAVHAFENTGTYGELNIALVYAARGDRNQAFAWLERAVTTRDLNLGHELKYDPAFGALRSDSRYVRLLREMKLQAGPQP